MFPPATRTDHANKSYKMAAGGVVPPAGTIGAFASGIMPQGAPLQEPEPEQPQPTQSQQEKPLTSGEQIEKYGSHR